MPDAALMNSQEFLMYATTQRGQRVMLGEGTVFKFSDGKEKPWVGSIRVSHLEQDGDGNEIYKPDEAGRAMVEKLEETTDFKAGRIHYVKSAEDLALERKSAKQIEERERMRADIESGLMTLNLGSMDKQSLVALADRVGAEFKNANRTVFKEERLRESILKHLGVGDEKTPAVTEGAKDSPNQ